MTKHFSAYRQILILLVTFICVSYVEARPAVALAPQHVDQQLANEFLEGADPAGIGCVDVLV